MEITLAAIAAKRLRPKDDGMTAAVDGYVARAARYGPVQAMWFDGEDGLLRWAARQPGRGAAAVVLFDPRGKMVSSDEFAGMLGKRRDEGTQRLALALGPADGWSEGFRAGAAAMVSFGRITLPHELARVVAAEQIYRALTILAGHPYHCGH